MYRGLDARELHVIVMPTEKCNFRCTYCYETFESGRMRPWIVRALVEWLEIRAPELDSLAIAWFGGEPLLARAVIDDVMGAVQRLAVANPKLRVSGDITTNGWFLTPDVAGRLLELGVRRYQVSFDGPAAEHDRTRRRAGGGATFERIWGNLSAMRRRDATFRMLMRLHASADNEASLGSFLEAFAAEFGGDPRFAVFLRPLSPLGGPADATFGYLAAERMADVFVRLRERADELGVELVTPDDLETVCYASRGNSLVVRSDGRIGKCTVALDHPANQVGRLRPGGRMELSGPDMRRWMRGLFSGDRATLVCPMKGLAEGGDGELRRAGAGGAGRGGSAGSAGSGVAANSTAVRWVRSPQRAGVGN